MSRIRILTANLWNGRADALALAERLAAWRVDVACFQELGTHQASAAARVLPHGKLEPGGDFNGMGIALRRPAEVERLPLPRRDARVARLRPGEWPGLRAPLEIVNVHVQAPHVSPWRSLPLRRAQLARLARYLDETSAPHRVLVGDLNATPRWPLYRRLVERLHDGAEHFARARGRAPAATWSPWPGAPRLLRIDHVLVSGVALAHCEVVELPGSDHAGVLAEVDLG